MALNFEKVNYTDGQTTILAKNLNDIQDAILQIDQMIESESVNPVEKSEDMTNPVGVDEDGKLWCRPGDGEDLQPIIERIEALEYEPVEIVRFEVTPYKTNPGFPLNPTALDNPVLLGNVADRLDFTYQLSKAAETTVAGEALGKVNEGRFSWLGQDLCATGTYTMTATDDGSPRHSPHTANGSYTIVFANYLFWGAAAAPATVDGAFLQGLGKSALNNTKSRTITVNAASGHYIWYALPKRLGAVSFKVGGFDGGFEAAQTVSVTNAAGYAEDYYVYRSSNPGLGNTTVVIT